MKMNPEKVEERLRHFRNVLREAGVKLTHQRLEIFREVVRSGDHPDAVTIHKHVLKRTPTMSLDTVYRTLWLLHDLGLITTLGPSRGGLRFDANMNSHHHFVCMRCGLTRDFCSRAFDELKIPDEVKILGHVEKTRVEFRGLCAGCAQKKKR